MKTFLLMSLLFFCSIVGVMLAYADIAEETGAFEGSPRAIARRAVGERDIIVYEVQKDNTWLGQFRLSPKGKLLAIIETTFDEGKEGVDYAPPRNNLVICDMDGVVVLTIDEDVRKFSWNPDGSKIAFITGNYYEGGYGYTAPH